MKPIGPVVGQIKPKEQTTEAEKLKNLIDLSKNKLLKPLKSIAII